MPEPVGPRARSEAVGTAPGHRLGRRCSQGQGQLPSSVGSLAGAEPAPEESAKATLGTSGASGGGALRAGLSHLQPQSPPSIRWEGALAPETPVHPHLAGAGGLLEQQRGAQASGSHVLGLKGRERKNQGDLPG